MRHRLFSHFNRRRAHFHGTFVTKCWSVKSNVLHQLKLLPTIHACPLRQHASEGNGMFWRWTRNSDGPFNERLGHWRWDLPDCYFNFLLSSRKCPPTTLILRPCVIYSFIPSQCFFKLPLFSDSPGRVRFLSQVRKCFWVRIVSTKRFSKVFRGFSIWTAHFRVRQRCHFHGKIKHAGTHS